MFPKKSYLIIGLSLFVVGCPTADMDSSDSSGDGCACLNKDNIYQVLGTSAVSSTAACDDNNDVLLSGGCTWDEEIPGRLSIPKYNDDPSQPAEWYCENVSIGLSVAKAFCLSVD